MSEFRVTYVDNADKQYDRSAVEISCHPKAKGKLFLGDFNAASFLQLKYRSCKSVVSCSTDMWGYCKENGVNYLKLDTEDTALFDTAKQFIDKELSLGKNVVVFCCNGMGKSAAIIIYYRLKYGSSIASTYLDLQKRRGNINIRPDTMKFLIKEEVSTLGHPSIDLAGRGHREVLFLKTLQTANSQSLLVLFGAGIFCVLLCLLFIAFTG